MLFILVFLYLGGGALWDVKTGKIPNRYLLFWLAVFGICVVWQGVCGLPSGDLPPSGMAGGVPAVLDRGCVPGMLSGLGRYLAGVAFTAAVLFPLFFFRMMGAGDIKLMALLGGVFGVRQGAGIIFCGLAAAAAWSFFYMVRKRIFLKRIGYFLNYVMNYAGGCWPAGEPAPYYNAERDGREAAFCLAPFLLCGYLVWLVVKGELR